MYFLNKLALLLIFIYQKILSSHTGMLKDFLYKEPVCTHFPHCSEYGKQCFQKYDFLTALRYTMERIDNCIPDDKITYDPCSYKVVFFSSSPIGVPFLKELFNDKRFDVLAVVTMPDAPSGRGQKLKENIIAEEVGKIFGKSSKKTIIKDEMNEINEIESELGKIKIFKPKKLKNNKVFVEELKKLNPDYFVVISYGKIIPQEILDIPYFGPINIHGSILPKYRGASPIQSVFLNGENKTGISIMYMDKGMDSGDIIKILEIPLTKKDNTKTVIDQFIKLGPKFTNDVLWDFAKGKLKRIKQDEKLATYCKKFTKQDGQIDFEKETAEEIYRKFQAFYLWPGIYTYWDGKLVKFTDIDTVPGDDTIKIGTKKGDIFIKKLKIEGKKEMTAKEFLNGYKDKFTFLKNLDNETTKSSG